MVMLMVMLMTNDDNLNELHMPASPNDIVQPNLVLPTKLHPKKPVPLRRRQLLAIRDGHALKYFLSVLLLPYGGPNLFVDLEKLGEAAVDGAVGVAALHRAVHQADQGPDRQDIIRRGDFYD